jgi:tRNA A-37 threonylcarbamoyl transferase component Bud32
MDSLDSAETLDRGQLPAPGPAAIAPVGHDGKLTIRYKRRGNGLFMNIVLMPIVLFSIFKLLCFAFLIDGIALAVLVRNWPTTVMLTCFVIYWLMRQFGPKHEIVFAPGCISFDKLWAGSLHDRCTRNWDDLRGVEFNGMLKPEELSSGDLMVGCSVTLDFQSGGSAVLELSKLSKGDLKRLFFEIEKHCDQSVFSKPALALERCILTGECAGDIDPAILIDSLESQYAATHFVPLKAGTMLQSGRYEIVMQMRSGGMSAVYLADIYKREGLSHETGHQVVIKESVLPLHTDLRIREKAKELFKREAHILSKLDHPGIVRLLDFFVESDRDYIVLEYKSGATLRHVTQKNSACSEQLVLTWSKQIADMLVYLHSFSPPIVHRDVTPDNLLVTPSGDVVLIDFGASNEFVSQATGTLVGKQSYIPPEQFKGKAVLESDIYAFGATLHFLLTGRDPVPLSSSHPATINDGISSQMDELVAVCTAMNAASRPSAERLKVMLEQFKVGARV